MPSLSLRVAAQAEYAGQGSDLQATLASAADASLSLNDQEGLLGWSLSEWPTIKELQVGPGPGPGPGGGLPACVYACVYTYVVCRRSDTAGDMPGPWQVPRVLSALLGIGA